MLELIVRAFVWTSLILLSFPALSPSSACSTLLILSAVDTVLLGYRNSVLKTIVRSVFSAVVGTLAVFLVIVGLGAAMLHETLSPLSLTLAFIITLSVFTPLVLVANFYSKSPTSNVRNALLLSPACALDRYLAWTFYAPVTLAWASGATMALDWQRSWLYWPFPVVIGILSGVVLTQAATLVLAFVGKLDVKTEVCRNPKELSYKMTRSM